MSDQYRGTIKQSFAWWDVGGANIPQGLFSDFDEKFKAWERRRGFKTDEDDNPESPEPYQKLRGSALSAKLAFESKKRVLAAEAAKAAKKKKLTTRKKSTNFAPDIVGKQFASKDNARRKIKQYVLKNIADIPADYEFGVNRIDWGCYEITGYRKQTKK